MWSYLVQNVNAEKVKRRIPNTIVGKKILYKASGFHVVLNSYCVF